jgi:hypothetical protein
VCLYIRIIICDGDILTLQLNVIQTISGVNKCTSCRQIFKQSNTQHTDSGFFIYTESDMLEWKVQSGMLQWKV